MSVLKQIESGVRAALADVEGRVLLQVLREQLPSMTFGDLRDFLGTPLGRRLQGLSVLEALSGVSQAATVAAPTAEATTRANEAAPRSGVPKAKTSAKKSTKKAAKAPEPAAKAPEPAAKAPEPAAKATKVSPSATTRKAAAGAKKASAKQASAPARRQGAADDGASTQALVDQVRSLLQRARGPVRNGELTAVLGISRFRVLAALQRLVEAGEAVTLGHPKRPSYVLTGAPAKAGGEAAPVESVPTKAANEAAPAPAKSAKAGRAKAAKSGAKAAKAGAKAAKAGRAKAAKAGAKAAKGETEAAAEAAKPTESAPAPAASAAEAKPEAAKGAAKAADPGFLEQIGLTGEWTLASQLRKGTELPAHRFTEEMRALLDAGLIEKIGNTGQTKYRRVGAAV